MVSNQEGVNQAVIQENLNNWIFNTQTLFLDCSLALPRAAARPEAITQILFLLSNNIYNRWSQDSNHIELRDSLLGFLFSGEDYNQNVYDVAAECLAKIAVFSILDEWTDFWSFSIPDQNDPPIIFAQKLNLASKFCKEIDSCPHLTINTKYQIKEINSQITTPLYDAVVFGIQDENIAPYALRSLNAIMGWAVLQDLLNADIINQLCMGFLGLATTQKDALDCLNTIFIRRTDSVQSFRQYAAIVIYALVNLKDPNNPSLPITNNKDVMDFVMKLLQRFLSVIDTLFFPPSEDLDPDIQQQITNEADLIMEGLAQYKVTKEQFAEQLLSLYRVVLSIDPENVTPSFWKLFNDITRKMYFEGVSASPTQPRHFYEFFSDLLDFMRTQIYSLLSTAVEEEGFCSFDARSCWSMLLQINPEEMIQFLTEQETESLNDSIAFFYAVGCLEFVSIPDASKTDGIFQSVIDFIDSVDFSETEPDVIVALLFASSHCTQYLSKNKDALVHVIDFALQCIQQDGKLPVIGSHTLFYLVQRQIALLLENDMEIAQAIVESSEGFLLQLPQDVMVRMFKVCAQLISKSEDQQVVVSFFQTLFQPVIDTITAFYENPTDPDNATQCSNALDMLTGVVLSLDKNGNLMCDMFAPMLIELGPHIYGEDQFSEVSDALLCALASLMTKGSYEDIHEKFEETLNMLLGKREQFSSVFPFIRIVRSQHEQIDSLFPLIKERFVDPALELEDPPYEDIFLMLSKFNFNVIDPQFMTQLFVAGVQNYSHEINDAAFTCWKDLMKKLKPGQQFLSILYNTSQDVLGVSFSALTDMFHGNSFEKIVDFIRSVFENINKAGISDPNFIGMVVNILNTVCGEEPRPSMYNEFVNYLRSSSSSPNRFIRGITDFLSSLHKLSPIDTDMFKVEEFNHFSFLPVDRSKQIQTLTDTIRKRMQEEDHVLTPVLGGSSAKKSFRMTRRMFKL